MKISTLFLLIIGFFSSMNSHAGFEENLGQIKTPDGKINHEVVYIGHSNNLKITLRKNGFSYEALSSEWNNEEISNRIQSAQLDVKIPFTIHRIDFEFPTTPNSIIGMDKMGHTKHSYSSEHEIGNIPAYKKVLYKNVWPNTDVLFTIGEGGFKYDIIFNSLDNIEHFYIKVNGSSETNVLPNGKLQLKIGQTILEEMIPMSYGLKNGEVYRETCRYRFDEKRSIIQFVFPELSFYDGFIIDPQPEILWGTYFGGAEYDIVTRIAVDSSNHVYQTGITTSTTNISTTGAFNQSYMGDLDIFVSRYNPDGEMLWSTYFGGPQTERAYGIACTADNHVIVGGTSFSEFGITTPGAYQETVAGMDDAFLVKFDENGTRIWGTYYGGTGHDFVTAININSTGNIYITGHTRSTNGIATSGTFLETMTATEAAYLSKFTENGFLIWGTYIGTEGSTSGEGIAFDGDFTYLGGRSNGFNGVSTLNSHQPNKQGGIGFHDAFLAKFNDNGTISWSTYYGGDFSEQGYGVAVDDEGFVYLNGNASSLNNISTPGAYMPSRLSSESGFLVKFQSTGERVWGTYLGGYNANYIKVLTYLKGELISGGNTNSLTEIATPDAYQQYHSGDYDGFLLAIDTSGVLNWGTYYGGPETEQLNGLAIDQNNNIIISGHTGSTASGIVNQPAHQSDFGGGIFDGWVAKLCYKVTPTIQYINGELVASNADNYTWYLDGEPLSVTGNTITLDADGDYYVVTSSNGACEMSSESFTHSTVNLQSISFNSSLISIYPIPTNKSITISSPENIDQLEIIDSEGRIVYSNQRLNSGETLLNIEFLTAGLYIVKLLTNNSFEIKKIIKN